MANSGKKHPSDIHGEQGDDTLKTIKNVAAVRPERTDVLRHAGSGDEGQHVARKHRHRNDDLVFGSVPRQTMSLIVLVATLIIGLIFGIRMIHVSIPIFCIILVIELVIGIMLGNTPSFVPIVLCALLMIAGALTDMFVAICIGNVVMLGTIMVVKGE